MKEDFEIQNSRDFNKLANDFLKMQLSRVNDVQTIKKMISKPNQEQIAMEVSVSEDKRRVQEDEIVRALFSFREMNESKLKAINTLCRKTDKMSEEAIQNEAQWITEQRCSSQAQCESVMIDHKWQGSVIRGDTKKEQLVGCIWRFRDKISLLVAVMQAGKQRSEFYQAAASQVMKVQDQLDNSARQSYTQEQAYMLLLKHNQSVQREIKKYAKSKEGKTITQTEEQKQLCKDVSSASITTTTSSKSKFKGLETLQMLEQILGVENKTTLKDIQQKSQSIQTVPQSYVLASSSVRSTTNADIRQSKKEIEDNDYYKIQESYLKSLENQYAGLQKIKQAKKFKVIRSIIMIQKFWRFKHRQRRQIAANKIGQAYLDYKQRITNGIVKILKMRIQLYKLKRWLRHIFKMRRTKKNKLILQDKRFYQSHELSIVKIQSLIRSHLTRQFLNQTKFISKYNKQRISEKSYKYTLPKHLQVATVYSQILKIIVDRDLKAKYLSDYQRQAIAKFEYEWELYEAKLKKYMSNYTNFKDWVPQQNPQGQKYWLNTRTLEESYNHPSVLYYDINRKQMRKKAEDRLKEDLLRSEQHRAVTNSQQDQALSQLSDATLYVLDEMKFWGEVLVEFFEMDQSSSQQAMEEFRKELKEQMKEQEECDKIVEQIQKERREEYPSEDEQEDEETQKLQ